ncbi:MAG TPA: diguanylate cyclase [Cellvibrio sp.]|nr:diguanylate cyclase [Cellvibrio sp.]
MSVIRVCILVFSIFWGEASFAAAVEQASKLPAQVTISQTASNDINHEDYYFTQLLNLALSKTESQYGKVNLVELPNRNVDKRLRAELLVRNIDLLWSPTSPELETEFLPVRVSLLKELNNYRLLLIRPETQAQFSRVETLNDLRQFKGGMSAQWADANIMEANSLPLVKAVGYGKLFKMLAAKRFDYFSRGLYQIQTEVNFYPDLHLAIEKDLMLHYLNEVYFFVHKDNKALAQRLKLGLDAAQRDGSFDALFNSIPRYQWGLEQLKHHQRRIIHLLPIGESVSQLKAATN